jgi:hypothetical protein
VNAIKSGNSQRFSEDQLYTRSFHSLGVRDLLDARDQFHLHLVHKRNVFATAIGFYLIRNEDPDAGDHTKTASAAKKRGSFGERTLENSTVRPWSWPCVLAFVSQWQNMSDLRKHPESVVPPFLYLEDGRIVPVCVVKANQSTLPARTVNSSKLLATSLEGGSPIFVEAQGQRRMGSVGCIVSDGIDYFGLTNRHVAGNTGRDVKAVFNGIPSIVGVTESSLQLGERPFDEIYQNFPGRNTVVHLDAGLVKITDVCKWRATVNGKGIQDMVEFSADTASLDWIGFHVVAHGAVSGDISGEIRALFYRYKSMGGREYVSEFLIGSRTNSKRDEEKSGGKAKARLEESVPPTPLMTMPGDSGTLWCLDPEDTGGALRPVALEWGGQRLGNDPSDVSYLQFCLASSVAVICRELGLDIISDFRAEHTQYWGAVGHFKIAQQACFQVQDSSLRQFLLNNLDNISFSDDKQLLEATHLQAANFVPLSDVPDVVWKTNVNRVKRSVTRAQENWNHFADMDLPGKDGDTLLDMFAKDESSLEWSAWMNFYKTAPGPSEGSGPLANGSIPFRVWQIFTQLQKFAAAKDAKSFLCAAGIIAHYVGDACQPLHCSQHADGLNGSKTGVHSTYEDNMVEKFSDDIASGIDQIFKNQEFIPAAINNGRDAALEVVRLMKRCHEALPPEKICESYNQARPGGHSSPTKVASVLDPMWDACGQGTITCIADGIRTLASIWQAAVGKSTTWLAEEGKMDGTNDLMPIYEDLGFLPSLHLGNYTQNMIPGSDAPASSARQASTRPAGNRRPSRRKPVARTAAKQTKKKVRA